MSRSLRRPAWPLPAISLALLAIAASATGIVNGFTYDDRPVILENPFMRDLHGWWRAFTTPYWPPDWGSDGYRPLTSLAFKLEFALSGGNAMVIHGANIALYALSAVLAYYLARRVLPEWCAWVVAALFAVHPVHVEAVANGVGQSELLVAVFMIPAVTLYLRDRMRGDRFSSTDGVDAFVGLPLHADTIDGNGERRRQLRTDIVDVGGDLRSLEHDGHVDVGDLESSMFDQPRRVAQHRNT